MDRIPGDASLYIGDLFSPGQKEVRGDAHITHVLSALRPPLYQDEGGDEDSDSFHGLKHLIVEIDDLEDEDVIQHIPTSNDFIQEGVDSGGGVLVHCAAGKSRSATLLIAYLLSRNPTLTPSSALSLIRQTRPSAEPNKGFMTQLTLYHSMKCPASPADHPAYQRWLYRRHLNASIAAGTAPANILFSDEHEDPSTPAPSPLPSSPSSSFRCRRCRTPLATSRHLIPHTPKNTPSPSPKAPLCAHLFLEPLSWMRPELEKARLDGRLECPNTRCAANVGKYAWQGMRCSCGTWVVPAVCIARGRVDEGRG